MPHNQPACVYVKRGNTCKGTLWALTATNQYTPVKSFNARLQLSVTGALSGLYAIDGKTPSAGDVILVTQGTPSTDGLYAAASGAWKAIALVSALEDGFTVNIFDGNSAPSVYAVQG